ncbi:MAG: patatin-like phospholipase family protein [Thermocrispum sp.]
MSTAFVLCGGGSLGAVQVGMLRALRERGIVPDLLIGTSVGALNAAFISSAGLTSGSLDQLAAVWKRVRRKDVFPFAPWRQLRALTGHQHALCSNTSLRRLIEANLPYRRLEDASIPVHLVATNVLTGEPVCLSTGDPITAVLASSAIPAILPAVQIDGEWLCDGAVAANAGISQAVSLGADRVYLLPAGYACALPRPPSSAPGAALHALSLIIQRQALLEVAYHSNLVDLRVLPPLCPMSVSPLNFGHGAELIARGYRATRSWLASGDDRMPHLERFLAFHDHRPTDTESTTTDPRMA